MRHKKIPTKNRKKLKACDPFNTRVTSWKTENVKKKNWEPKVVETDQPLTQNLIQLQESMQKATSQGSFPKKRAAKKNKAVLAAEKMGIYKRRFEDMKSFLRRVEKTTFRAVQDHKMKIKQGTAARPQSEIDEEMQYLEDKEKTQKEQKKRSVENQIQKAKKEREAHSKQLEEKQKAKMERRRQYEEEAAEDAGQSEELEVPKPIKKEKSRPVFGVPRKPPVDEALINRREAISFGERYDEPPKFVGTLKTRLGPLNAKVFFLSYDNCSQAGSKSLLLHSVMKKTASESATYLQRDDQKRQEDQVEREKVIEAYRMLKKRRGANSSL